MSPTHGSIRDIVSEAASLRLRSAALSAIDLEHRVLPK